MSTPTCLRNANLGTSRTSELDVAFDRLEQRLGASQWRKQFAKLDPFAETLRDPRTVATDGHLCLMLLLLVAMVSYTTIVIVGFAHRPEVENFSLLPMSSVPPVNLSIQLRCSQPWLCHAMANRTSSGWTWSDTVHVVDGYTTVSSASCSSSDAQVPGAGNGRMNFQTVRGLCHDSTGGLFVRVPSFTTSCAYGDRACGLPYLSVIIRATSPPPGGGPAMQVRVELEPSQRKTVFVGVVVRSRQEDDHIGLIPNNNLATVDESYEPYSADLFYDGHTSDLSAELRIALKQFADHFVISRPGSLLGVIGEVGGAQGLMLTVMVIMAIIVRRLFDKCCSADKQLAAPVRAGHSAVPGATQEPMPSGATAVSV